MIALYFHLSFLSGSTPVRYLASKMEVIVGQTDLLKFLGLYFVSLSGYTMGKIRYLRLVYLCMSRNSWLIVLHLVYFYFSKIYLWECSVLKFDRKNYCVIYFNCCHFILKNVPYILSSSFILIWSFFPWINKSLF